MHISTKSRMAVNAVVDLALREAAGPVALATIGARQRISLSYLEQLFAHLKRAGIVESTRGPGGGYTLARPATEISVADIVSAVEESTDELRADPLQSAAAPRPGEADLWQRLRAVMLQHMGAITLASLVQEQLARGVSVELPQAPRRAIAPQRALRPLLPLAQAVVRTVPNSVFALARSFGH